jgi:flavodoxin I
MASVGIFFGTDSGTTRLMAKKISKKLGSDIAAKPINVNRITLSDMLSYDFIILGTPTYGDGITPGKDTGVKDGSWQEFFPNFTDNCLSGKTIALYGLGDQDKYSERFASGLGELYNKIISHGGSVVGSWSTEGYNFEHSGAVKDGEFVGLVLDQPNQALLTEERLDKWLEIIKPEIEKIN